MKKLLIVLCILVALIIAGCSSDNGAGEVIGSVNDENIYASEYDYYFNNIFSQYYTSYYDYILQTGVDLNDEESSKDYLANIESYSWDTVVQNALVRQIAKDDYDITLDDYYFDDLLDYGNLSFVQSKLYYNKLCDAIKAELEAEKDVTDKDIQAAYDADSDKWNTRKVSHILISISDPTNEEEVAAAKKEAEEVIAKLNDGGDFAELAKEYSDDTSASNGGALDLYFNSNGSDPEGTSSYYAEFATAAFKLAKVGDYTLTPVLTDAGYHIIKVDKIRNDFASVKDVIETSLRTVDDTTVTDTLTEKLDAAKEKAEIDRTLEFKYYTEDEEATDSGSNSDSSSDTESTK